MRKAGGRLTRVLEERELVVVELGGERCMFSRANHALELLEGVESLADPRVLREKIVCLGATITQTNVRPKRRPGRIGDGGAGRGE